MKKAKEVKNYSDSGMIPQALFQHRVAGYLSGLIDNVQLISELRNDWENFELAPGYTMADALDNMGTCAGELKQVIKEFIEFLDDKENDLVPTKRKNLFLKQMKEE